MPLKFYQVSPDGSEEDEETNDLARRLRQWLSSYNECIDFFINSAQYSGHVQAVAAFVNVRLPFQRLSPHALQSGSFYAPQQMRHPSGTILPGKYLYPVSIIPYIRRLVATGLDSQWMLQAFFGDSWREGIGHIHSSERYNFLFAAKSDSWLSVKSYYDMGEGQEIPFLVPFHTITEDQLCESERQWSEWLAMQDWMIGPRTPV